MNAWKALGAGLAAASLTIMTGCAGGAGGAGNAGVADPSGDGVRYGASKEEYAAALADMTPVTLVYQAGSSSSGHTHEREKAFAESIEEWSDGKITLDVVWGNAIAPYDEVVEAVADGRIDIGIDIPIYNPSKYPAMTDLSTLSAAPATGPLLAETANIAAAQEVAWSNDTVLDDLRDKGVEVLVPAEYEFSNALICSEPTTSLADLDGKQVRAGSATDFALIESVGASAVSLQLGEVYEALQRNVVDCAVLSLKIAASQGLLEVAPHVMFPTEGSWGRSSTALVASTKYAGLPLPARQLIFDKLEGSLGGQITSSAAWTADAAAIVEEHGGDFHRLDDDAEAALQDGIRGLREGDAVKVLSVDETGGELAAALEKWTAIAEEEGITEPAGWTELAAQVSDSPLEVDGYAKRMYEEIYLPHRPE